MVRTFLAIRSINNTNSYSVGNILFLDPLDIYAQLRYVLIVTRAMRAAALLKVAGLSVSSSILEQNCQSII